MTDLAVMSLQRGFVRLAIAVAAVWFTFWTTAYVFIPYTTLRADPSFAERVTAWSVVAPSIAAAVILGIWTVVGFRSR